MTLRELRKAAGKTLDETAALVGLDKSTIGRWEMAYYRPGQEYHRALANALGVDTTTLRAAIEATRQKGAHT